MKQLKTSQLINGVLGMVAFLLVLLAGLKTLFSWDWGAWFFMAVVLAVGIYLIIESGVKSYKTFRRAIGVKSGAGFIHLISFALGVLMVYIGIQMMPILGLPQLALNGWVLFLGGGWAILEGFIK